MNPRFSSDEEAMAFVKKVTAGQKLPIEIWMKILTDSGLPLIDVERMCHVNESFARLCITGELWRRMLVQKFGPEKLKDMEPYRLTKDEGKHVKLVFFALQIQKYGPAEWLLYQKSANVSIGLTKMKIVLLVQYGVGLDTSIFDSLAKQVVQWLGPYQKDSKQIYTWNTGAKHMSQQQELAIIYTALYYGFRSYSKRPYLQSCLLHPAAAAQALCGVCRQAAYCSQACADADWAAHKHVCSGKINFG